MRASVAVTVNPLAPTITAPAAASVNENSTLAFTGASAISAADASGTAEQLTLTVSHGALSLGTTTGLTVTGSGTSNLVLSGTLAALDADLASLVYAPTANYHGPDTLSLSDKDTTDNLTGTASVSITVAVLAPAITAPATASVTVNGTFAFSGASAISVTDLGGTAEQLTLTVGHGTLALGTTTGLTVTGSGTGTLVLSGPLATLNTDLASLVYAPTSGYHGPDTLSLSDADTTDSLTGTGSVSISVTGLQAPNVSSPTTPENTSVAVTITSNAADVSQVTNFQITGITNGTLTTSDGTTITNGGFITVAQGAAGLIFSPNANSTATGSFIVEEAIGSGAGATLGPPATATVIVTATNNPRANFTNNGPIVEGAAATVRFTNQIDPLIARNPRYRYSYDFNDDGTFEIRNSGNASVTVPASYLLTPGPHVVHGRITDRLGDFTDYTTTILVTASMPTATIRTPFTTVVPGEPVPFAIHVSDTSPAAQRAAYSYVISFGDGSTRTVNGRGSLLITHVYTTDGTYTAQVTVTDKFGNANVTATETIDVVPVAVEADPLNFRRTALYVGGTPGDDTFNFEPASGGIAVTVNGVSEGTFNTRGSLIIFGQGGEDSVQKPRSLCNHVELIENPNGDQAEGLLAREAIHWAGLMAALEILNA